MFSIQKKYIHQQQSYYHLLQQNILKTVAENCLFYTYRVKSFIYKRHTDIIINLIIFYFKIALKARKVESHKCFSETYRNHEKSIDHHILQQSTIKFWNSVTKKLFKIWKKVTYNHVGYNKFFHQNTIKIA